MNYILIKKNNGHLQLVEKVDGLKIKFLGDNSLVFIEEPFNFRNCFISMFNNSIIFIKHTKYYLCSLKILLFSSCSLFFRENCSIVSAVFSLEENNSHVFIGSDNMMSYGVTIRATDGHPIINLKNGYIINKSRPIVTGNHCWICHNATILKGSYLPDNSVLASNSLLTKKNFEQNIIVGGIPAKVLRRNVLWERAPVNAIATCKRLIENKLLLNNFAIFFNFIKNLISNYRNNNYSLIDNYLCTFKVSIYEIYKYFSLVRGDSLFIKKLFSNDSLKKFMNNV